MHDPTVTGEFRRRRTRQLIASGLVLAVVIPAALKGDDATFSIAGLPPEVTVTALFVLVVSVLIFSLWNWRCPACNRYLGKTLNPAYCARCGAQLRD